MWKIGAVQRHGHDRPLLATAEFRGWPAAKGSKQPCF